MNEELTIAQAAALLPVRNGKKVHVLTVKRWIRKGCRGVLLRGWKRGNNWFTSAEALEQFKRDCTAQSVTAAVRSSVQVSRAVAAAREQLRRKGFYGAERKNGGSKVLGLPIQGEDPGRLCGLLPSGLQGSEDRAGDVRRA